MKLVMDAIDIAGMVVVLIGVTVLTPIMVFALHQFYTIRKAQIMKFRNSPLVIAMNIFIIVGVLDRGYMALMVLWKVDQSLPSYARYIIQSLCISIIYLLIALKTWLLYFEQRYHLAVAQAAWKKLINERAQSWFIRHRQTYGDWKYLLKMGCLPSAVYMSLCIGMEVVVDVAWNASITTTFVALAINWMLHALPLLFSCTIYYRFHSKKFKDLYRISNEIKYQCFIVVVYEALQCTDIVFQLIYKQSSGDDGTLRRIEELCQFVLASSFLFGLSVFTSTYPVYLHLMTAQGQRLSELMAMDRSSNLPRRRNGGIADIGKIMRHQKGFKALMKHLVE